LKSSKDLLRFSASILHNLLWASARGTSFVPIRGVDSHDAFRQEK
jgi:hypothetical protein